MARIISVQRDEVSVQADTGEIKSFPITSFSFTPVVGEEVEIIHFNGKDTIQKHSELRREYIPPVNNSLNKKTVNKLTYCLLALFLGAFGAHKFYAKKIGWGIAYILLSFTGITSFVALVELIIALCRKADDNGNILI